MTKPADASALMLSEQRKELRELLDLAAETSKALEAERAKPGSTPACFYGDDGLARERLESAAVNALPALLDALDEAERGLEAAIASKRFVQFGDGARGYAVPIARARTALSKIRGDK